MAGGPIHKNYTTDDLHIPAYRSASDPGAVGAGREWQDTSTSPPTLKIRNTADSGWDIPLTGGVPAGSITLAMMANLAANSIIGNNTGSPAVPLALTVSQVRTLLALVIGTNVQAYSAVLDALTSVMSSTATVVAQRAALVVAGYNDSGNSGSTKTIDWSLAHTQLSTLTASCTYTFSNPVAGDVYILYCKQGGTGSFTVTWPGSVIWSGGTAPTLTTTVGKIDIITFTYDGTSFRGVTSGLNYA